MGKILFSHAGTPPAVVVQALPPSLGESIQTGLLVGAMVLLLAGSLVVIWAKMDVKYWLPIHVPVTPGRTDQSPPDFADRVDDRERVLQVLEREDGQLMQSRIVEKTDYSKVKTSRILAQLADDGDVIKVPVGRQNLICLPDNVPEILNEAQSHGRTDAMGDDEQPATAVEESNRPPQTARNDGKM